MVPPMRGRTSTYSVASRRPLNSSVSATGRCTAGATLTGAAGGGPPCASAGGLQAVTKASAARAPLHAATGRNSHDRVTSSRISRSPLGHLPRHEPIAMVSDPHLPAPVDRRPAHPPLRGRLILWEERDAGWRRADIPSLAASP